MKKKKLGIRIPPKVAIIFLIYVFVVFYGLDHIESTAERELEKPPRKLMQCLDMTKDLYRPC